MVAKVNLASRSVARAHRRAGSPIFRVKKQILHSRDRFWHANELPSSVSTSQRLLADLCRQGELVHVRKGLYWRGRSTPLGMSPPPPAALTKELVGTEGVGPAGASAALLLRLSTQVPRQSQVAVTGRPPSDIGPVKFVSRAARTGRRDANLSLIEVAVLEVLEGWSDVIEVPLPEAWKRLLQLLSSKEVSATRLGRAAGTEPGAVRARLAALLSDAGHDRAASLFPEPDPRTAARALKSALR